MLNCFKFHQILHSMTRLHISKYPVLAKKWYPELIWLIVCCKHAPTLAQQKRRHNYVIGRNEYLICIHCQNQLFLGYIHCNFCNFCLNPHIIQGDMKENVNGCFFWTQCSFQLVRLVGCDLNRWPAELTKYCLLTLYTVLELSSVGAIL